MMDKYRVHEVAKDLNIPSKDILGLLEQYFPDAQRKHMTALSDEELSLIFERFTQERQMENLDPYFALAQQKKAEPEPEPAPIPEKAAAPVQSAPQPRPAQPAQPAQQRPAAQHGEGAAVRVLHNLQGGFPVPAGKDPVGGVQKAVHVEPAGEQKG